MKLVVRFALRGCSVGTWSSAPPRGVTRHEVGRPLRLARLVDKDLVVRFTSRGCSVGAQSSASPHGVARRELGWWTVSKEFLGLDTRFLDAR
jgi:hypothetical protein